MYLVSLILLVYGADFSLTESNILNNVTDTFVMRKCSGDSCRVPVG